ncbi:hypothetical protein STEG23_024617, partial [Scotinomys teguina]
TTYRGKVEIYIFINPSNQMDEPNVSKQQFWAGASGGRQEGHLLKDRSKKQNRER